MSERFLVIDDSSTIQKVVQLAFAPFDVEISVANSYIEAINESNNQSPSLIFADASLPGIKGADDYRNLQDKLNHVPFVILIGSYDGIDRSAFEDCGFEYFLQKPFEASELIRSAWDALGRELSRQVDEKHGVPPPPPALAQTSVPPNRVAMNLDDTLPPPPPVSDSSVPPSTMSAPPPPPISQNPETDGPRFTTQIDLDDDESFGDFAEPAETASRDLESTEQDYEYTNDDAMESEGEYETHPNSPDDGDDYPETNATSRRFEESGGEFDDQPESSFNPLAMEGSFSPPPPPPEEFGGSAPSSASMGMMPEEGSYGIDPSYRGGSSDSDEHEDRERIQGLMEPFWRDELAKVVRETVEDYCERHFAKIAREVISAELEKLTSEKSRLLIDN
ncbi:response regulator [Pseudobacteriovorax antillogorgiicola]|uniref:CheY chemotaxis protein or a CheY-like REC (Receiver) domain n=1 Tax=Pseudobacteriovorax antillogorgiicola TaxID=1513793 RepID=A0A1Y6B929_9BACT|nr:response regulator [Pseudobacteriovorax antillogorgiicola]TCS58569.1 CheY-like chemotaxis protein [Pseudobacteriovorax antillogorgiicola]SME97420.1 CheY chemotaxis protein or a CheY-like REC (receiver) domain [Pseudobacteriovorax antillogorgiicola]